MRLVAVGTVYSTRTRADRVGNSAVRSKGGQSKVTNGSTVGDAVGIGVVGEAVGARVLGEMLGAGEGDSVVHARLLALLGAISEAESFPVKPGRIMRKVYRKNQDIPSYIFGGYGVSDLDECFRVAGRECRKGT